MLSRSTPDLDQSIENERSRIPATFTNTASLYNLDSPFKDRPLLAPPLPPLPKARSQQLISTNTVANANIQKNPQSSSPSSSTYSSFNSSINSNVKSILKKSNSNLVLLEHLKSSPDLFDSGCRKTVNRRDSKLAFNRNGALDEETRLSRRCSLSKSVSTFKSDNSQKKLDDYKPKKQVHFRSSFNDELIVEHITNQELIEEEQIYDDIITTRLKQTSTESSEEEQVEGQLSTDNRKYSNQSPENSTTTTATKSTFDTLLNDKNDKILSTGKNFISVFLFANLKFSNCCFLLLLNV